LVAILVGSWDHRTQFWKGAIPKLCPTVHTSDQDGCHSRT
jgi:hypothetical protein